MLASLITMCSGSRSFVNVITTPAFPRKTHRVVGGIEPLITEEERENASSVVHGRRNNDIVNISQLSKRAFTILILKLFSSEMCISILYVDVNVTLGKYVHNV